MAFNPRDLNPSALKSLVDNLARHYKANPSPVPLKRSALQEHVAATLGWPNWHAAITAAKANAKAKASPKSKLAPSTEAPASTEVAPSKAPAPSVLFPRLLDRPVAPIPLPSVVSELSSELLGWLSARSRRPAQVTEAGNAIVLTWEEVVAADGLLALWLWQLSSGAGLPEGVKLSLWEDKTSLTGVLPVLDMQGAALPSLVAALKEVWKKNEAARPGRLNVEVTHWLQEFQQAFPRPAATQAT